MRLIGVELSQNGKYWRARWYAPDGTRMSKSLGPMRKMSRRAAEEECSRIAWELNCGRMAPGDCPTLAEWVAHHRRVRDVKPSTATTQDTTIDKYLLPRFGERRMDEVTLPDAKLWVEWLKEQPGIKSRNTVGGHLRTARMLWARAIEAHGGPNPFRLVKFKYATPDPVVPNLDEDDVLRLIDAAPSASWKARIAFCALAGLRLGEAHLMTWERVQWDRNRLLVPQPKTERASEDAKKDRECLMVPALSRILAECLEGRTGRLCVAKTGRNLHRDMLVIVSRAGLSTWPKPFHGLRKWRSSTWKDQYPAPVVDAWLGHGAEVARRHYYEVPESHYGQKSEVERLREQVAALTARVKTVDSTESTV